MLAVKKKCAESLAALIGDKFGAGLLSAEDVFAML